MREIELTISVKLPITFNVDPGQKLILNPPDRAQEGLEPQIIDVDIPIDAKKIKARLIEALIEEYLDELMDSVDEDI